MGKGEATETRKTPASTQPGSSQSRSGRGDTVRLRRRAHRVATLLESVYASPRHDNKDDPLDELIFIILSQMTTHKSLVRTYEHVKAQHPTWDSVMGLSLPEVQALIRGAGLSHNKAPRIKKILERVKEDFGEVDLRALNRMSNEEALRYLTSLPGVGEKTARCVMMFSLGRQVLPVDTHVSRVARRLGFIPADTPERLVHAELERVIYPADRYSFHVNSVAHGRNTCTAVRPRCADCLLYEICPYPESQESGIYATCR